MGNKALIRWGGASLLVLLLIALIVWLTVVSTVTDQPSATRASSSSPETAEPKDQQALQKAGSQTGTDAQAKARQALENDLALQEEFHASLAASDNEGETRTETNADAQAKSRQEEKSTAVQNNFSLPVEGNAQGIITSDGGAGRREKASAASPPGNDTSSVVTAKTCSGAPIELYVGEKRMLDLHNQTRAEHRLSPLCIHSALTKAARDYSQDMLDRDYFSHYSPEGSDPMDRVRRAGYTSCGRTSMCGENLAVGAGYSSTPDILFEALMNSPGHRANILRKEFREVGIGLRTGSYKKYRGTASMYSVEFAGRP